MNIVIVHPYQIHAGAVGGSTRVFELTRFFARRHRVAVYTYADGTGNAGCPVLAQMGVEQHIFPLPRPSRPLQARWLLDSSAPYYVHRNRNAAMATALAAAADAVDVVHLELGYMAPAIEQMGGGVIRGLAEQEVMPLMLERLGCVPWRERSVYECIAPLMIERAVRFDRRALPLFDLVYGITARDSAFLAASARRPAAVLPHVVSMSRFTASMPHEQEPARVLFVGNFAHRPNVHAASWFMRDIWPRVAAQVETARCEIVGPGMDRALQRRVSSPATVISGYQPDLAACYRRATVVVNPVISGGGMRGKVLEAMASAAALVSTTVGLEGVAAISGSHCTVADDPRAFAEAIVAYLTNPLLRRAHGEAARRLVAQQYDAPVVFARLESDYQAAVDARRHAWRTPA
ncbi:MAG: glycosyltransferase [Vicinamibacterales bacterium]